MAQVKEQNPAQAQNNPNRNSESGGEKRTRTRRPYYNRRPRRPAPRAGPPPPQGAGRARAARPAGPPGGTLQGLAGIGRARRSGEGCPACNGGSARVKRRPRPP